MRGTKVLLKREVHPNCTQSTHSFPPDLPKTPDCALTDHAYTVSFLNLFLNTSRQSWKNQDWDQRPIGGRTPSVLVAGYTNKVWIKHTVWVLPVYLVIANRKDLLKHGQELIVKWIGQFVERQTGMCRQSSAVQNHFQFCLRVSSMLWYPCYHWSLWSLDSYRSYAWSENLN